RSATEWVGCCAPRDEEGVRTGDDWTRKISAAVQTSSSSLWSTIQSDKAPYLFFFSYSRADWEYDVYLAKFFEDLEKKVAIVTGAGTRKVGLVAVLGVTLFGRGPRGKTDVKQSAAPTPSPLRAAAPARAARTAGGARPRAARAVKRAKRARAKRK